MNVATELKKMDLIRFNLAIIPKSKSTYVTILVIALLTFGGICLRNGVPETSASSMAALVGSLAGGIIGLLVSIVFCIVSIMSSSSLKNGILGKHEYTLSPEGLHEKTSANEGISKWEGVTMVETAGPYLLIQVSGYLFHIVPKRSFESRSDFDRFVSASMEYWRNAHNHAKHGDR